MHSTVTQSRINLGMLINQSASLRYNFTRTGQIGWAQVTAAFIFCFSANTNEFSLSASTFPFSSHLPIFSSKRLFSFNHNKFMQSGAKQQQLALGSCVQFKNWHLAGVMPPWSFRHARPHLLWVKMPPFRMAADVHLNPPKKVLLESILRLPPSQRELATATASRNSSTLI